MDARPPHILVVEDNQATRQALAALLEEEGYRVSTAEGGVAALELAHKDPPGLVLSDVCMPAGDGFFLVGELRKRPETEDVPILLLSALDDTPRRVAGLDSGADDYLRKPVDPDELMARIRAHLRHYRRQRELLESSLTDPTTGLLNRRGLEHALSREAQRAQRGAHVALLLADMDGFKAINDRHGHAAGDYVLRHVARSLSDVARAVDHAGRLGGDEFVVLLSDCNLAGARVAAERARERIEREILLPSGVLMTPRVSLGVAAAHSDSEVQHLIEAADADMYRDKGRRRSSDLQRLH